MLRGYTYVYGVLLYIRGAIMRYVTAIIVLSILISKMICVCKSEREIMLSEIKEKQRILDESIGDPDSLAWKHHEN